MYVCAVDEDGACENCGGSGVCPECHGSGAESDPGKGPDCEGCDGIGVCELCKGHGIGPRVEWE